MEARMPVSVRYIVSDVEKAISFYTGMLGFRVAFQYEGAIA